MIVVKLMGGLGNQMFQYAAGRQLALKRQTELKLDLSWFDNVEAINTSRPYELNAYPIKASSAKTNELVLAQGKTSRTLFGKVFTRKLTAFNEPDQTFYPNVLSLPDNTYLVGYWQNEGYFKDIREQLLLELKPKKLSKYSKEVLIQIGGSPSVALHVRRGDYVSNKHANKFHGLAPVDYYKKALVMLEKNIGEYRQFVFSDDIDWCRANLPLAKDAVFVGGNGLERACEDIFLMQNCNHNIIANSSFSWWGAWLNDNPAKIVIAPKQWFQNQESNKDADIVPRAWIRL